MEREDVYRIIKKHLNEWVQSGRNGCMDRIVDDVMELWGKRLLDELKKFGDEITEKHYGLSDQSKSYFQVVKEALAKRGIK